MEEERRAVDFYLGHGRQISYTLRVMGYPSRQKLMEWIDELAPGERINHEGYLRREKHPAMKKKAGCVMRLATRPGSAEEAAMEAGVSRSSLYVWKRELLDDINITMGRRKAKEAEEIIAGYRRSIAELEERNRELEERRHKAEIELACLEKAAELIKKGRGISLEGLKNREKALVIDALRKRFRLKELLPVLAIGKNSWCYCNKAAGIDRHAKLRIAIRRLFEENDGRHEYRRILHLLEREDMTVLKKFVRPHHEG